MVLEAVGDPADMKRNLISDMIAEIFLPAVEVAAREQASENFRDGMLGSIRRW